MTTRQQIRAWREANNWAKVRNAALCWGETGTGADYRHLLDVMDGKVVLTEERLSLIRMAPNYHTTTSGDSVGDDIQALLSAISARRQ